MDVVHREKLHPLRPGGPLTIGSSPEADRSTPGAATVLLVGHGSHLSADSSRPVHELARHLRAGGRFGEVRVAFWKEEPPLHHAFDLVEGRDVAVVPVFTSEGYFTARVLPRELGLDGAATGPGGHRVRYFPPVGSHPGMARVVLDRAGEAVAWSARERTDATLVVIGHGTVRHPLSGSTTYALADRLREESDYGEVLPAFLDQEPRLAEVIASASGRLVVAVPFFVSDGWHAGTTIPRDLQATHADERVRYAASVGSHPSLEGVVHDLLSEPASFEIPSAPSRSDWTAPASEARRAFLQWIREGKGRFRVYLQTAVRLLESGRFEVRHVDDVDRPAEELEEREGVDEALDLAARTTDGSHRPLRSAPTLTGGWRFAERTGEEVWEIYARLYPAIPVQQIEWDRGRLRVRGFEEVARQQTGMFGGLEALSGSGLADAVERCCAPSSCLRAPTWYRPSRRDGREVEPADGTNPGGTSAPFGGTPPCARPCSVLLSAAKEALDLEVSQG